MDKDKLKQMLKELIPYLVILVVVVLIRTFLVTPVIVKGDSMLPTLQSSNLMILNKRASIDRFDIVVIDAGDDEIIKRVIALPGETISCENGKIYVNDHLQEEEYSLESDYCTRDQTGQRVTTFEKITLEDDEYFCMGDNRDASKDSRAYGPFKRKQIKGTTKLRLFPFNKIGNVK